MQVVLLRSKATVSQRGRAQVEPLNDSGVSTQQTTPRQRELPLLASPNHSPDCLVRSLSSEIKEAWV